MTFLNNFYICKSFLLQYKGVWEGICPSLGFEYELLTPLELGERLIFVNNYVLQKLKCACIRWSSGHYSLVEPVRFANMIDVFDLSRVTPEDRTGAQAAVRSSRIHLFFVNIIHFVYTGTIVH